MNKSEKEKKLLILLPCLIGISIFVWIPNFQKTNHYLGQGNALHLNKELPLLETILPDLSMSKRNYQEEKSIYPSWGRNPFIVKGWSIDNKAKQSTNYYISPEEIDKEQPLTLKGIFWNNVKPSALINDEVIGVGAKLGMYKVLAITKYEVIISNGTRKQSLMMRE